MKFDFTYLSLLNDVSLHGTWQFDRTSVGKSKQSFGGVVKFNTYNKYAPFIQCRTFSPRIAFEEWKWMMTGSTDVTKLQEKDVHIWDGNSTREFLDSRGLFNTPENTIGKAYGYQYRSFGGVTDQVAKVLESIKSNPTSRRHVISIWNPNELHEMALEPCFHLYEFVVINDVLNLYVHGRSSDVVFGLPYNAAFAFFWLLTFARATNLKMGEIMITTSNTHYYSNQVPLVTKLLSEETTTMLLERTTPTVTLKKPIYMMDSIESLEFEDFVITDWVKGPKLVDEKIEMAV